MPAKLYVTKKFPKEVMKELVGEDFSEFEGKDLVSVKDRIIDNGRWEIHHEVIFSYDGKYYRSSYSRGATELQEEYPYDDEGEEVSVVQVEAVPVTTFMYKPVEHVSEDSKV